MGNPNLLLDEPTEDSAPTRSARKARLKTADRALPFLAEQNKTALRLSDRGYIIDNGRSARGKYRRTVGNEEVRRNTVI
jgi:ABC-type branched-subunit amino acid transport system ATPase component